MMERCIYEGCDFICQHRICHIQIIFTVDTVTEVTGYKSIMMLMQSKLQLF